MTLGEKIKRYRDELGLTLDQLSEMSGVDRGTINALEIRKSNQSKYAPALAAAFGLTMDQLWSDTDYLPDLQAGLRPMDAGTAPAAADGHSDPQTADALQALHAKTRVLRPAIRSAAITLIAAYLSADDDQEQIADAIRHLIGDSP